MVTKAMVNLLLPVQLLNLSREIAQVLRIQKFMSLKCLKTVMNAN